MRICKSSLTLSTMSSRNCAAEAVNRAAALFNFQFPLYHLWRSCHLKTDRFMLPVVTKRLPSLTGRLSFQQG